MKEHCNVALIPLTQGKYAVVDIWNYEWLNQWKWHAQPSKNKYIRDTYYACRKKNWELIEGKRKRQSVWMQRVIMDTPKNSVVGYIDGNSLINLESNMLNLTPEENTKTKWKVKNCRSTNRK